ncbi:hypothetical protein [Hahella sp. CCB-MM4]|uniref:hypothetical protein n=1 Tax=Hahella sp. (strain CCB-MM4) TaxID=1926491 RepID=UPI0011400805|nr:hypothetical protein [Hahella sp. CCB-MM4]
MNRITNKNKRNATGEWAQHPRPFIKKLGNAKLRKEPIETEEKSGRWGNKKVKKFRQPHLCPFCLANIHNQYIGAKFKLYGSCKACGAVKQGTKCGHCKSRDIWLLGDNIMCKNCGKKPRSESPLLS